jgi:hypothetical protein
MNNKKPSGRKYMLDWNKLDRLTQLTKKSNPICEKIQIGQVINPADKEK